MVAQERHVEESAVEADLMVTALRAGDHDAQHRFWERHFAEVDAICGRVLGRGADASDEAVNVMVDFLFKYVHHVVDGRAAPYYLRLMATRRARKLRDKRRRFSPHGADHEIADAAATGADEAALSAALMPKLDACLKRLTTKARRALALRYRADLTSEAIGALLGGSKQYIGRLIAQSLSALRACLGESTSVAGGDA